MFTGGRPELQNGPRPVLDRIGSGVGAHGCRRYGAPKPHDEDVVEGTSPTIHTDLDLSGFQARGESSSCELRLLVGIEDLRLTLCPTAGVVVRRLIDRLQAHQCHLYRPSL